MTADNPITDLLTAPLRPDWTVDRLAEEVLRTIAARASDEVEEFVLDEEATTDRQSRRLIRPLLACLATKSAAEAGTSPNLYGGRLSFKRPGQDGSVWILGHYENKPGAARVIFRRTSLLPRFSGPTIVETFDPPDTGYRPTPPPTQMGGPGPDERLATTDEAKQRIPKISHG